MVAPNCSDTTQIYICGQLAKLSAAHVRLRSIERTVVRLAISKLRWSTIPQLEAPAVARRTRPGEEGTFIKGECYLDMADDIAPGDDQAGA